MALLRPTIDYNALTKNSVGKNIKIMKYSFDFGSVLVGLGFKINNRGKSIMIFLLEAIKISD